MKIYFKILILFLSYIFYSHRVESAKRSAKAPMEIKQVPPLIYPSKTIRNTSNKLEEKLNSLDMNTKTKNFFLSKTDGRTGANSLNALSLAKFTTLIIVAILTLKNQKYIARAYHDRFTLNEADQKKLKVLNKEIEKLERKQNKTKNEIEELEQYRIKRSIIRYPYEN